VQQIVTNDDIVVYLITE